MNSVLNGDSTAVGLTWSPHIGQYLTECPENVDFVEVAFEQLRFGTSIEDLDKPTILHCASLSMAGFVDPSTALIKEVADSIVASKTPWIGEHLAFLSASSLRNSDKILTSNFTLAPQLSAQTVERVVSNWEKLQSQFCVPLILENPPQYFEMPGSTMNIVQFIKEVCAESNCGVLLDLAHLLISSQNFGLDPFSLLQQIPWDNVVEIHIADSRIYEGIAWDNHSNSPNETLWDMLEYTLLQCKPSAITMEYNWIIGYQKDFYSQQIERVRNSLSS